MLSSALLACGLLTAAGPQFDLPGLLQVHATVNGRGADDRCRLFAYPDRTPGELALEGPMNEPLRLAPGLYRVRVECEASGGKLVSWLRRVKVRSDATTSERVSLASGAIIVHTVRDGGDIFADVEVVDPELGEVLAKGFTGNRLVVPAGRQEVRVRFAEQTAFPCHTGRAVTVARGRTSKLRLDLSDGTVRVNVTHNGRAARGLVSLFRPGSAERLIEFASGRTELVPPGRYDMVVAIESSYDFEGQRIKNIEVRPGQLTRQTAAFTMGTLRVDARLLGQAVPARVYLYLPGAPDYFNFADAAQAIDLTPGRYRVRVSLDESVPYDAARPREMGMEREVQVRARQQQRVRFDFTPGVLKVIALKNGEPATAATTVWLRDPRVKLTGGAAGEPVAIAAGVYDIDVLFPNGRGGDLVQLRDVKIATGGETVKRVNIERGGLTIDTYDRGARVNAEVRFFKKSSKAPFLTVRGGETAELPPGSYEIEIVFGDKQRWVSAMHVKPGGWEVRKVEF